MKQMQTTKTPMLLIKRLGSFAVVTCCAATHIGAAQTALPSVASPAVYYANQAGAIAGAAESCGQPITTMTMRSSEVIGILANNNPQDAAAANAAFETAHQAAKANSAQQPVCAQVINDFNSLPLLQPDYQTRVLAPLRASNNAPTATPAAATPANATPSLPGTLFNATTAAALSAAPGAANNLPIAPAPPPANPVFPALSTPAQNYVASNNNPQNGVPPINPAYAPPSNSNDAEKIRLAQQLAQMAQSLVATNNTPSTVPPPEWNNNNQRNLSGQVDPTSQISPIWNNGPLSYGAQP
jgi:hypothetical protein